jgi:transcriptional regulator with XRE-family HTH domain
MADLPIGLAVRRVRRRKKMTQIQLAKITGFPRTYICNAERGAKHPQIDNMCLFADALQMEPWQLVYIACQIRKKLER